MTKNYKFLKTLSAVWVTLFYSVPLSAQYQANWMSLYERPVPQWFKDSKFGIFIHWGVYAVPVY
ncbi:alpha-L-fucosidase [Ferruginibacter sp.]|uniref:alpha-L-fucosidase n=1 Tax=Ferruginibacter sp. TaxID=1940288 RepID=UPI00265A6BA5|nr:alpha-L-fucosidase [Ferruginibacter sp.]